MWTGLESRPNLLKIGFIATKIRTAILGTGFMSWVHADALRRNGVEVYGILGSSSAKSRAAAVQLGAAKTR